VTSDPFALVAVGAWCFAVAMAGGLVGLVLGNIRLPVVVLVASSPAAGAGANLGISGVAAAAASIAHLRAGRTNWRLFAWMAPPSMAGAVVGGYAAGAIPDEALLAVIGVTLLYFGIDLLRSRHGSSPTPGGSRIEADAPLDVRAAVLTGAGIGPAGRTGRATGGGGPRDAGAGGGLSSASRFHRHFTLAKDLGNTRPFPRA